MVHVELYRLRFLVQGDIGHDHGRDMQVRLEDILLFCTGANAIPIGGFQTQPKVEFVHDTCRTLVTASTCEMVMWRLPTVFSNDSHKFNEMLFLSFKGYEGYGHV